ncbi:succinylglutamate desuccinylase [Neolewinella aurantiaca]|uniref:Succinylglutamate desuccinylase n=1 Tax=Neolewinella aurantiaca TaxID=2602767 RepID=A0A5C7FWW7_9BACT|nr:succinylglutamate desuccinylase/aspartoacylase family protein [Neolewinella aurantiaca]TXF89391.1 succinylglutamate desuccinylase [Neolewinella aurantiaca]
MGKIAESERIIGHYRGAENGPLVVAIGGIHGNEPAGVLALERLFEMLADEPRLNPGFSFKGEFLALRGNLEALALGKRFIDVDLNRIWRPLEGRPDQSSTSEDHELHELLAAIETAVEEAPLSELILLDIHTTTAQGGIFAITGDDAPSLSLAAEMSVPVIKGMLSGLQGTTLHYFRGNHFATNLPVRAISFEAGNHEDPLSVDLALAATINLLRALGCVKDEDVNSFHDQLLRERAANLPRLTELTYVHKIDHHGGDGFQMKPGYKNFQPVLKGELLATDKSGSITAPTDGYLLMPLYQKQGDEGFFIVRNYKFPLAY